MITLNYLLKELASYKKRVDPSFEGVYHLQKVIKDAPLFKSLKTLHIIVWKLSPNREKTLICEMSQTIPYSESNKDKIWEKIEESFIPIVFDNVLGDERV